MWVMASAVRKLLASSFSTVFAVLQGLPGSLPWGVLLTFLNDFLSQHKNMSIAQATWVRCCCYAVSSLYCDPHTWGSCTHHREAHTVSDHLERFVNQILWSQ